MNKISAINKKLYRAFLSLIGLTKDKTSRNLFRLFQVAAYAASIVFLINLTSLWGKDPGFGTFGDFFGGVLNPILTFLTFMGLLITIVLQQKELALTRQELHTSALALSQQAETQEKQRFEDTFFALLEQHNRLLDKIVENSVSYDSNGTPGNTESIVESLRTQLIGGIYFSLYENNLDLRDSKAKLVTFKPILNQYFRVLYQILKFIASNCPASAVKGKFHELFLTAAECSQEEKLYANIVRSFLSEDIYYLLAINCFCEDQNDHFIEYKLLVERYSFFEHMPIINVPKTYNANIIQEIVKHYSKRAFGKNTGVG
ncbi:putative phage abortive infection protein [Methylobacter sp.]|uniref:putative phage abortive infection protein n=1 Tax=Methylobacter sp. TaxID=2051955 RepID=UPI002FDD46CA